MLENSLHKWLNRFDSARIEYLELSDATALIFTAVFTSFISNKPRTAKFCNSRVLLIDYILSLNLETMAPAPTIIHLPIPLSHVQAIAQKIRAATRSHLLASYAEYITEYIDTRPDPIEARKGFKVRPERPGITLDESRRWKTIFHRLTAKPLNPEDQRMISVLLALQQLLGVPSYNYLLSLLNLYGHQWMLKCSDVKRLVTERDWQKLREVL